MPIYEYACQRCGHEFELLVRASQTVHCPNCGSQQLRKLVSRPASPPTHNKALPVCAPESTYGCGLPGCGQGRCLGLEN